MQSQDVYQQLLTELLRKCITIFGHDIVHEKIKHISGLHVNAEGTVTRLSGNPPEIIEKVIAELKTLSGVVTERIAASLFDKRSTETTQKESKETSSVNDEIASQQKNSADGTTTISHWSRTLPGSVLNEMIDIISPTQ